jgi:hypothetical protein
VANLSEAMAHQGEPQEVHLQFEGSVLDTAKWIVLAILASLLVVPLAWVNAAMARWLCRSTHLSDGTLASFRGTGGDVVVWHILLLLISFAVQFLLGADQSDPANLPVVFVLYIANLAIVLTILQWFVHNIHLHTGPQLTFTGSFFGFLGWYVAFLLSAITIIGWAWVAVAMYRWMARHVKGQGVALEFRASGLEFLWRTLVFAFGSILIVTIPFLANWFLRWLIQSIVLVRGVPTSLDEFIAQRKPPRTQTSQAGPPVFGPID